MACIEYTPRNFNAKTQVTIQRVNDILDEYEKQGFDLTVRQIYYQFVSRDWIKNSLKDYKNLAGVINDARLAGLIDWNRIVDRTRFLREVSTWKEPWNIIEACAKQYKEDLWRDQKNRVEVWIEKDALVGVIERVCAASRVPFLSCRGYTSQSEMWGAAQRLEAFYQAGQTVHIIHLGDHDPSGIDMTRDIQDRMDLFISPGAVHMHRIALNMDQVLAYAPPPNPAKVTDSRADKYIALYGEESWELDALKPTIIEALIRDEITKLRDNKKWNALQKIEDTHKAEIAQIADNYTDIRAVLKKLDDVKAWLADQE